MYEPKPLDGLFKENLFRVPDYQRGYAWGPEQWDAFWQDLINLPDSRSHYTGVLIRIPTKSNGDSGRCRTVIPIHAEHLGWGVGTGIGAG